jgi:CHAT domain-containing protein/tetratricopeptide (TPR) repeat protein
MNLVMIGQLVWTLFGSAGAEVRCAERLEPAPAIQHTVKSSATEDAVDLLWIEESGAHLKLRSGVEWIDIAAGPVRYGIYPVVLPAQQAVTIVAVDGKPAPVAISRNCVALGDLASVGWWQELNRVALNITGRDRQPTELLERALQRAATPFQIAAVRHLQSFAQAVSGHSRSAYVQYLDVIERWLALGESSRAGAATLGAAQTAYVAGLTKESLTYARLAQARLQGASDHVFHDMAIYAECLALQIIGETELTRLCLQRASAAFARSDDLNGTANTLNALAQFEYTQGRIQASIAAEQAAFELDAKRVSPLIRGRSWLLAAWRLGDSGDIGPAMLAYAQALEQFAVAGDSGKMWEIEALSKLSRLYAKLGLTDMAYTTVERLLREVPAREDPIQVAILLITLSHVEEAGERPLAALRWARLATHIYTLLQRPSGVFEGRLRQAEIQLRHGLDADPALDLMQIGAATVQSPPDLVRIKLLRALQAAQAGDVARSAQLAEEVEADGLDVGQQNLAIAVRARSAMQRDHAAQAVQIVRVGIEQSANRAMLGSSVGQGWLAMRATAPLRPLLVDLWSSLPPPQRIAETLWQPWLASLPARVVRPGHAAQSSDFGASGALGREFLFELDGSDTDIAVARNLGESNRATEFAIAAVPQLTQLQAHLLPDDLLLALASGRSHSVLLRITRERVELELLPPRQVLLEAALAFSAQVQDRGSDRVQLEQSRKPLESMLLAQVGTSPPKRLLLLLDDVLSNVPVAALHWPGDSHPLIQRMQVSWISDIRFAAQSTEPRSVTNQPLQVVIADRLQDATDKLPDLRGAELEADLIASAMPSAELGILHGVGADRQLLLDAMVKPGNWLHLASHGSAQPGMLGRAGIWLAGAAATDAPQFLSWLDVADQPLAADLVVLNACQTAAVDRHAVTQGSMSFALAVSAAGSRNTVAAFWPVSDAATGLWVPAFYGWMAGRNADASAEALRRAQVALLSSRTYRHPYYWASLGHFQRIAIAESAQ